MKGQKGILVKCDASILQIIKNIDSRDKDDIILAELDDEHVLIREAKLPLLKAKLNAELKDTLREADTSDSDDK